MTSSWTAARSSPLKATEQNAHASPDFAAKLAQTEALLRRAAADFQPLTQASSLGAEDVVITHLINRLRLDIPVFVLDTGALHTETLALLERTQAHSRAPIHVFRPVHASVMQFVRDPGQGASDRRHRRSRQPHRTLELVVLFGVAGDARHGFHGLHGEVT